MDSQPGDIPPSMPAAATSTSQQTPAPQVENVTVETTSNTLTSEVEPNNDTEMSNAN